MFEYVCINALNSFPASDAINPGMLPPTIPTPGKFLPSKPLIKSSISFKDWSTSDSFDS